MYFGSKNNALLILDGFGFKNCLWVLFFYSLINMRQFQNLFNQAKTWHRIVCWFLCFTPFLPEFTWSEAKIVLNIKKEQF